MADVQIHFDEFHEMIKLRRYEENRTLREKRDIIRRRLDERICTTPGRMSRLSHPGPGELCGGYWAGVVPLKGDFDIDQGLYFDIDEDDWDAVTLKQRVRDALAGHTRGSGGRAGVRIRRPCVTVQYHRSDAPVYHVDIAVYADGSNFSDGLPRIAMGKEQSAEENCGWEAADPRGLNDLIMSAYRKDDGRQFRRVIRYLKRWKDLRSSAGGHAAPRGIALTVACYEHFVPTYRARDWPDDLAALQEVVVDCLGIFVTAQGHGSSEADGAFRFHFP